MSFILLACAVAALLALLFSRRPSNRERSRIKDALLGGSAKRPEPLRPEETFTVTPTTTETVTYGMCGHEGARTFEANFWGTRLQSGEGDVEKRLCPPCVLNDARKKVIRCGLCGHAILPGQNVSLFHRSDELKPWAHRTEQGYVGCISIDCDASIGYAGRWDGKTVVPAFPTKNEQRK